MHPARHTRNLYSCAEGTSPGSKCCKVCAPPQVSGYAKCDWNEPYKVKVVTGSRTVKNPITGVYQTQDITKEGEAMHGLVIRCVMGRRRRRLRERQWIEPAGREQCS